MTEVDLQLAMPDGLCDAVLFSPEPATPLPGVLHVPDIASIREAQREMAQRLAAEGYAVLLVNPFYRTGRPPVWSFPRVWSEPKTIQRFQELTAPLTPDAQMRDAAAYLDLLLTQEAVQRGPVGVVGYCFGGGMALRTAAAGGERVAAAASFHGGGLFKADDPSSPHLLLPQVTAQLYFGHATEGRSMNADDIAQFEEALAAWGGKYASETYPAHHGWTVPDNPAYNSAEAERSFTRLKELFAETLKYRTDRMPG
jgi:carboxymethylenebutenolidase